MNHANVKLHGLVAATHTPFHADGALNLAIVERQAEHLRAAGVETVFIGGSTGECHSLSLDERLALALRWGDVLRGAPGMRLVVHVGCNCLADARALASQAQTVGAGAIAALAPSYFKPRSVDVLVDCCADIASAAPGLPFYFYDIPSMTGVNLSMPDFLDAGATCLPTLAGIKFTNSDLLAYQRCLRAAGGRFDIPWGTDEALLAALAVGAAGGVGSTYNFAAPLYRRLIDAFNRGDLAAARAEQIRSVRLVEMLSGFGYMGAAKAVMAVLGVDVGAARLPNTNPTPAQRATLEQRLGELGFFDWLKA